MAKAPSSWPKAPSWGAKAPSSLLLALALTGCATGPKLDVPTRVKTVEVKVPVYTPCLDKSAVPTLPGKVGSQLTGDAPHDLEVVSAALIRMRAIADQAISMLGACAK